MISAGRARKHSGASTFKRSQAYFRCVPASVSRAAAVHSARQWSSRSSKHLPRASGALNFDRPTPPFAKALCASRTSRFASFQTPILQIWSCRFAFEHNLHRDQASSRRSSSPKCESTRKRISGQETEEPFDIWIRNHIIKNFDGTSMMQDKFVSKSDLLTKYGL